MNETPAQMREQARQIRRLAQYAQGQSYHDEIYSAQELERKAYELEQQLMTEAGDVQ